MWWGRWLPPAAQPRTQPGERSFLWKLLGIERGPALAYTALESKPADVAPPAQRVSPPPAPTAPPGDRKSHVAGTSVQSRVLARAYRIEPNQTHTPQPPPPPPPHPTHPALHTPHTYFTTHPPSQQSHTNPHPPPHP
ncbi:hypothetical protein CCS92_34330, partial [Methylobacterium radiotolerans]